MSRQRFNTSDVLRLEVEADPASGQLRNLVPNPSGDLGGWGWLSPVAGTTVGPGAQPLTLKTLATQAAHFSTEPLPIGGSHAYAEFAVLDSTFGATVGVRARFEYLDAAGALISSGTQTAVTTTNTFYTVPIAAVPAGTVYVRLRFDLYRSGGNPSANDYVSLEHVLVVSGTSAEISAGFVVSLGWVDILGPTHEITIERAELDLGTLTATILDSSLDPSQADTLRKGKPIRLVLDSSDEPLFTGQILNARVAYDPLHVDAAKRARIQLTAVDQAQPLSNVIRPEGVAAVEELRAVLEGCGVPWNVNGDIGQTGAVPVVVARNENASAMDQVAVTRDSNLGYAWFSRAGVVNVWDFDALATAAGTPVATLDEDAYNAEGLSIDYDSERCINHVTLKYLRIDPVTGETEEVTYGPYTDDASRAKWGTHAAEFTVQGITEDAATLTAYAAVILAANSIPAVRVNEVTVPINTTADVSAWALLDLYDLVTLTPPASAP